MKTSFALWIAVCLAVAVTSALVVFSLGRQGTVVTMNASPLHCTVCEPVQDGEIAATSFETVEVVWNVANLSDEVLDGLEARADCRCHVLKAFPDSLKPNETARVSIRVAAPVAGIAERQIPVYCRNRSGPVGTMHVRFRVDVTPPFWIDPPKRVALQGVVGQKSSHEAVWECIEKAGSRRIIEGAELEPHSSALSLSMQVTDVPWDEDGTLLKRKYQLQFSVEPESTDSPTARFVS